jgi:hypothetical protein
MVKKKMLKINHLKIKIVFREREDRKVLNKEDFILDKLKDQTIYRLPGSVNGQQFISMFKLLISSYNQLFFLLLL